MEAVPDKALTIATNLGRLLRDTATLFVERVLFRNDKATLSDAPNQKPIETVADLIERLKEVYGEETLNWAIYCVWGVIAAVIAKLLFDAIRIFSSSSEVDKQLAELKKGKKVKRPTSGKSSSSKDTADADTPTVSTPTTPATAPAPSPVVSKEEVELRAVVDKASTTAPNATSNLMGPPISTLLNAKAPLKKSYKGSSKGTQFPVHIGAFAVSPGQQYLLISCRQSKDARVYPQGKTAVFMEKGSELSQAVDYFLPLGKVLGTALKIAADPNTGVSPVDVSIAAFQHSSPLGASSFINPTAASHAVSAAEGSADILDDSNEYVVVGESTTDTYVIMRLYRETGTGKSKFAQVHAQVLWKYNRPGNIPVWKCDGLALFSSFASHLEHPVAPQCGESLRQGVKSSLTISDRTMGSILVFVSKEEGAVSAVHRDAPTANYGQVQKFNVGGGTCIVASDPFLLVAGDFLVEPRISQLLVNRFPSATSVSRHPWFSIDKLCSLQSIGADLGGGHSPMVLKNCGNKRATVVGMAMVQPHLPIERAKDSGSIHIPSFVVTVDETGSVYVYDVDAAGLSPFKKGDRNPYRHYFGLGTHESTITSTAQTTVSPKVPIAHVQVPAMAGMKGNHSYGASSLSAAIVVYSPKESGNVSHSTFRLVIGLTNVHDRRVTLLASCPPTTSSDEQLGLTVVAQWSNLHPKYTATGEDNTIKGIAFVQGGRGIASVGDDDGEGVALRLVPGIDC